MSVATTYEHGPRTTSATTPALPVTLSAAAHGRFRLAQELIRTIPGIANAEMYFCLVAERSRLNRVSRLELPRQDVSAGQCRAWHESVREIADSLAPAGEVIVGSIHLHPGSLGSHGFLSVTDYELLEQSAREARSSLLRTVTRSLPRLRQRITMGTETSLTDAEGNVLATGPESGTLEAWLDAGSDGAIHTTHHVADVYTLVNAGLGYYGKVLRTRVCAACREVVETLHAAEVEVEEGDWHEDEDELRDLMADRIIPTSRSSGLVCVSYSLPRKGPSRLALVRHAQAARAERDEETDRDAERCKLLEQWIRSGEDRLNTWKRELAELQGRAT